MSGFPVHLHPPDLEPWRRGNTGVPGFTSFAAAAPGPHVLLLALIHGNELAGAIVLDRLLRAGLRPARGRLSFGFANLRAMDQFDPSDPTISRCVEEDLNRVWDPAVLAGPRHSHELDRAREILDFLHDVTVVLDLHSMLWPSTPLLLSGRTARGLALCRQIGRPGLIVSDQGHPSGKRLIDHPYFTGDDLRRIAVLLEAGLHWRTETVDCTEECVAAALHSLGMTASPPSAAPPPRVAQVTHTILARSEAFAFVRPLQGGEIIPRCNTLLALDGGEAIRTPYDQCMVVMPNLKPGRGHTAMRLACVEERVLNVLSSA